MDIAIIGYAFDLPGCSSMDELQELLFSGKDAITTAQESDQDGNQGENWRPFAGFIESHNQFDYELFGLSLRDSLIIDPQQRMFSQLAFRALEHGGYNPRNMAECVGVYSAASDTHYAQEILDSDLQIDLYDPFEFEIGSNKEQQSLRTSFLLNLRGPSMGVQSACSSGLLTIHVAMQGLHAGDCDIALAGGSCFPYPEHRGYRYREGMNWSDKGRIRSFDAEADGMIAGFGSVVWVLKPLAQAQIDGDCVHSVIKASRVNNDGRFKSTYTAPSTSAISDNLKRLLEVAQIDKETVDFVEAHGSGTRIGDVLEAAALCEALGRENQGRTAVSSVKSVLGHLDTVAGHAGLLKAVAQIQNNAIAPAANFTSLNPAVNFGERGLYVPTEKVEGARVGVVNSLGIGGTNCSLLVTAANDDRDSGEISGDKFQCIVGADTEERLVKVAGSIAQELSVRSDNIVDIAFTLNRRYAGKKYIVVLAADSREAIVTQLRSLSNSQIVKNSPSTRETSNGPASAGVVLPLSTTEIDGNVVVQLPKGRIQKSQNEKEGGSVAAVLESIWKDTLMVDDLGVEPSFIGLGGHSMMALSLLDEIKRELEVSLPLDWVETNDSFQDQVASLEELASGGQTFNSIKYLNQQPAARARIVLVHASLSGAEKYSPLTEYCPEDVELIAVDSHNLYADSDKFIEDINALADYYLAAILPCLTDGKPLILGGWSLGGMLSRLIAEKLATDGSHNVVAHVAMDSVIFSDDYRSLFLDKNLRYFLEVDNFVSESHSGQSASRRRLEQLFRVERRMAIDFFPGEVTFPTLNIVATEPKHTIDDQEVLEAFKRAKNDNGWRSGEINTVYLATDHENIVNTSNLRVIAELFERLINERL